MSAWCVSSCFLWAVESVVDPIPSRCFRCHCYNHPPWRIAAGFSMFFLASCCSTPKAIHLLEHKNNGHNQWNQTEVRDTFRSLLGMRVHVNFHSGDGGRLLWKRVSPADLEGLCRSQMGVWTQELTHWYALFLCFPSCPMTHNPNN